MARGKAIELFLADGTAGGLTTAGIADWTGILVSARRNQLSQLNKRPEAQSNGVYILLGNDPDSIENTWCYIGKTENFVERLRTHDNRKDKWERVVIIASLQRSFNEGHWGYLESRLVEIAQEAERCSMPDNKQVPRLRKLSEAQAASAESFLDSVRLILPILGVNVLRSPEQETVEDGTRVSASPVFHLRRQKDGVNAQMRLIDGEYFVLKGSVAVGQWSAHKASTKSTVSSYNALASRYQKLIDDGSIRIQDGHGMVTRDIAFNSPSTAAAMMLGTSANGRSRWINDAGQTFGGWEESLNAQ